MDKDTKKIITLLYIAAGGFLGTCLRYAVCALFSEYFELPGEIIIVNTTGCFIFAFSIGILSKKSSKNIKMLEKALTTGFCGAFTTFSAFKGEWFLLIEKGQFFYAASFFILSILLGVTGIYAGHKASIFYIKKGEGNV